MVTQNLTAALLRFRYPDRRRDLWIDTICIDQSAISERNHQVRLMGEIYQRADRVLIWLGEEDNETEDAYDLWSILESPSRKQLAGIEAFTELLDRRWFSRAWTYQECRLAHESLIITGSYQIPGSSVTFIEHTIRNLVEGVGFCLLENDFMSFMPRLSALFSTRFMTKWIEDSDFWGALGFLLSLRRGAKSQDPRDIVYSLLGVAGLTGVQEVEPDYGLSWEEVCTSITRNLIHRKNNLDLLGSAFDRSDCSLSLPTWAPDWRVERSSLHLPTSNFGEPRQYCALGFSVVQLLPLDDTTRLGLQGLLCDKVYRIGISKAEITEFIDRNHLNSGESLFGDYFDNFMTSGGLLGFGPGKVAIGDSIFVLLGRNVPYLLRRA